MSKALVSNHGEWTKSNVSNSHGHSWRTCRVRVWRMRAGISIILEPATAAVWRRSRGDRNARISMFGAPKIVLLSRRHGTAEIMRRTGKAKTLRVALAGTLHEGVTRALAR